MQLTETEFAALVVVVSLMIPPGVVLLAAWWVRRAEQPSVDDGPCPECYQMRRHRFGCAVGQFEAEWRKHQRSRRARRFEAERSAIRRAP